MELFFIWFWFTGSIVAADVARKKRLGGFVWFLIALLTSPLVALIALAGMPDQR